MPRLSNGLSTAASICVMVVIISCFAFLWPTIFYPMIRVGLNWRGNSDASWEKKVPETMLPPKVREALKSSPIRESVRMQKREERPQFYSGAGRHFKAERPSSQSSAMNIIMPVFTLIVICFCIFIVIRLGLTPTETETPASGAPSHRQHHCDQCHHSHTGPYPQAPSGLLRNRDTLMDTASHRAMSYLGQGDPNKSMHDLVSDMETFRNHLAVAEMIKSELEKLELARNAAAKQAPSCQSRQEESQKSIHEEDKPGGKPQCEPNPVDHKLDTLKDNGQKVAADVCSKEENDQPQNKDVETCGNANESAPAQNEAMLIPKRYYKIKYSKYKVKRRKARKVSITNIENVPPVKSKKVHVNGERKGDNGFKDVEEMMQRQVRQSHPKSE